MPRDERYNGWANYATWRVNLEVFDGQTARDLGISGMTPYRAGQALKEQCEELIEDASEPGAARDWAMSFISDVEWQEIAEHVLEDDEDGDDDEDEDDDESDEE